MRGKLKLLFLKFEVISIDLNPNNPLIIVFLSLNQDFIASALVNDELEISPICLGFFHVKKNCNRRSFFSVMIFAKFRVLVPTVFLIYGIFCISNFGPGSAMLPYFLFYKRFDADKQQWQETAQHLFSLRIWVILRIYYTKEYPESSQTSKMDLFAKIVNGFQALTMFSKSSILYAWLGFNIYLTRRAIVWSKLNIKATK